MQRHASRLQPKRALLAWEFGAGRTHYGSLLAVARHLRRAGVECLATLHDLGVADREFAAIGVRTVQNFVWPSQKRFRGAWEAPRGNGFTDFLASIGLNSSEAVAACIAHYDGLFSLFRPDLVLCEQAYGAVLAARDHLPVVVMATATHMPPIVGDGFPLLPGRTEPGYPVADLLHDINVGLGIAGRFPLADMADLLRRAIVVPLGPAEFDMYQDLRQGRVLPPLVSGVPDPVTLGERNELFVYIHGFAQRNEPLMAALAALDLPARAYIPGITAETRRRLASLDIHDEPVPVAEIVARSGAVLHHGGVQLTAVCLATGTPQVVLTKELDNRIAAAYVEAQGLGLGRELDGATTEWIDAAIRRACGDDEMRRRCAAAAPAFYAKWFARDPSELLASYVLERMDLPPVAPAR